MNPGSLKVMPNCRLEPALVDATLGQPVQFERLGYFCVDTDSKDENLVFNRVVGLRDSWAKAKRSA